MSRRVDREAQTTTTRLDGYVIDLAICNVSAAAFATTCYFQYLSETLSQCSLRNFSVVLCVSRTSFSCDVQSACRSAPFCSSSFYLRADFFLAQVTLVFVVCIFFYTVCLSPILSGGRIAGASGQEQRRPVHRSSRGTPQGEEGSWRAGRNSRQSVPTDQLPRRAGSPCLHRHGIKVFVYNKRMRQPFGTQVSTTVVVGT